MPVPTKKDLKDFCRIDGWTDITKVRRPDGSKRKTGDHFRYTKTLPDGQVLRTRVSHGDGPAFGDPGLWSHVWRDQLGLDGEEQFWEALRTGKPVTRGSVIATIGPPAPVEPKPAWLVEYLIYRAKIPEQQVHEMSLDAATAEYNRRIGLSP